jgi:hypothetical protein
MDLLLDKNIRLKYTKNGDVYYLGMLNGNSCFNLKKTIDTACTSNVAVLQKVKTPDASFKLVKQFNKNTYFLASNNNAKLCHNLNALVKPSPYMCFSLGADINDTTFTIETSDLGNILVFNKQTVNADKSVTNTSYYVAECGVTGLCKFKDDIYLKLCLVTDKSTAIHFEFLSLDDDTVIKAEPTQVPTHTQPMDIPAESPSLPSISMEHTMETFDNMSNLSLISQCSTMSLPGPGGMDEYASWDVKSLF